MQIPIKLIQLITRKLKKQTKTTEVEADWTSSKRAKVTICEAYSSTTRISNSVHHLSIQKRLFPS